MARKQAVHRSIDGITRPVRSVPLHRRYYRKLRQSRFLQVSIAVIGIVLISIIVWVVTRIIQTPNYDDVTTMTNALSKHVIVPNEKPILATVTNKEALKTPFLKNTENGDRIAIYPVAKKVIVYRPSIDRIVDIGPVDLNNIPKTTQ